jgi:hypothetical protein
MPSLRSIFSQWNESFSSEEMLRKLGMTDF